MYGWTKEQTSKIQNDSNKCGKSHNFQLEQELHDIFGSSSNDYLDEEINEVEEEANNQRKMKVQTKRKFRMQWLDKFHWLNYVRHDDKISMKCSYCEKYRISGPWGLGSCCTTLQHDVLFN